MEFRTQFRMEFGLRGGEFRVECRMAERSLEWSLIRL